MLIKEIVKLDTQGKFISAVQLSDYDNSTDNLSLVKSYIFASNVPEVQRGESRAVGSVDLLRDLRLSYINSSVNRFAIIANYGHGKSHLGLVLANYFSKPYKSQEVQEILGRIGHTLQQNQPEVENFHEFKREYDRFLVIRLRGDTPRTLREQFFPALKSALQEHPDTQNAELPFWNQQAKQWLGSKAKDSQAQQFLKEQFRTDFPNLLQEVEDNKQEAYEQYVKLFAHLNNGVEPNAEGNFSLREAVIFAVDTFCKNAKPLAGVVVLFDEFSQFIERYSQSKAIGDLQDLLQGIGDRKGQAMFLAFAQHDPDEVAERVQSGQSLQNIKRELGRIDRKYALYSIMENVLNSYLAQSDDAWEQFLQEETSTRGWLYGEATELAWELYLKRYDKELHWSNTEFRRVVTKGCFPLHPLTTALLCHLRMQQGLDDDARTILRFIRGRFELRQNTPAIKDGKINWILPIDLLDYFGSRIAKQQDYEAYENAIENLEQVFGDNVTQAQYDILKAMLLQVADGLNLAGEKQVTLLSQMAGIDYRSALQLLKDLGKNNITRYDENTKHNSFWPIAANPKALEQKIREQINDKKFGEEELFELNQNFRKLIPNADHIEVNIAWGTSLDWAANTAIVTKEKLTTKHLQELTKPFKLTFQGFQDGNRGLVVWLMALADDDIQYFQKNAPLVLQEAFPGEIPPPIVIVLPKYANKNLADQFIRYQALQQIGKDKEAIKEIGQATYDAELERTKKALVKALDQLLGDEQMYASISRKPQDIVIPSNYKAYLLSLEMVSLQSVLKKLYELAYPYRPSEFFTDLNANPKKGASPLREGVKTVCKSLIFNRVPSTFAGMNRMAQERVCKQNLMAKWHLLTTTYYIQEPDVLSLKRAWEYLDSQIKPDEQEVYVNSFIPNLFNSPYGFDYNTAALLLTAWIGKHNNELRFYSNGKVISLDYLEKLIDQGTPQDFLGKICTTELLALSRRDSDKALSEGRNLVESIQKGKERSQTQAEKDITILNDIIIQGICPEDEQAVFTQAVADLNSGLDAARQYDKGAKKLLDSIAGEDNLRKLLDLKQEIKRLEETTFVLRTQPANTEIEEKLNQQIKKSVNMACTRAENLTHIEGADASRNILKDCKELLQRDNLLDLVQVVSQAENRLKERIKNLKAVEEEKALVNQINSMTTNATLAELYEYQKTLKKMPDGSPKFVEFRGKKLYAVEQEITRLVSFAFKVVEMAKGSKREQVDSQYEEIVRQFSRYVGTEYETVLSDAKLYLGFFRNFLSKLQSIESRTIRLRTQDDFQDILKDIDQLENEYGSELGKNHKALLENARLSLMNKAKDEHSKLEKRINLIAQELETPSVKYTDIRAKIGSISGFITTDLQTRIDLLHKKLAEKEAEFERVQNEKLEQERIAKLKKQEEETKLQQINSIKPAGASLDILYKHVEYITTIPDISTNVKTVKDQKLKAVQVEISKLEDLVSKVKNTYAQANREQAENLLNEIKGKAWRFEETEHEEQLNQAKQYLEKLIFFFSELAKVKLLPIDAPEDLSSIKNQIEQVVAKSDLMIVESHKVDIENALKDADCRAETAFTKTESTIKALEAELPNGKLAELKSKINRMSGYITPELSARLDVLRSQLDQKETELEMARIERETQDIMERIVKLFISITDIKKRQECIDQLLKLQE